MFSLKKNKITNVQTVVIITNYILAAGILSLPRTSVEAVKTPDAWISVILGGCGSIILGIIMVKLSQRFPKKTFYQYSPELLGKVFGNLLSCILIVYFLALSAFELRVLVEVTSYLILEETPRWAIMMPFLWIGVYLLAGGINSLARMFEIIFPITVLFFLLTIFMSFKIFEPDNLRPFLGEGILPIIKGVKSTILTFIGAEIMLLLVAFMEEPKKAVKMLIIGVAIPLIFDLITVIMVIGALSIDGVLHLTWPTLDLIRSYEIEGLIFERFESFLLVIWTMQIFSTFCITYFSSTLGLSQLFKRESRMFLFILPPIIYVISTIPKTIDKVFMFGDFISKVAIIFFTLIPLSLLLIAKWKETSNDHVSSS
ncbi:GerAB/ArcD/ProY family transporter [Cytobacillus praedii]|uniref:GerAB/ArcD/ProY family transporter n=1 Tax=Cytobacillus praedii TaxID=1742358 RepID=UPI003AF4E0E8